MKSILTFIFFLCMTFSAQAQDWKVVAKISGIEDLFSDEKSNLLYVVGGFDSINGKYIRGIATWDGSKWGELDYGTHFDTVPHTWGGGVSHISRYKGKLVVAGTFDHVGYYKKSRNVAYWDSDSLKWETCDWNPDGNVKFVYETGDTTYVLGTYDSIAGKYSLGANYLFKNKWTNMSPPKGVNIPNVLCRYKGSLYLGGNMNSSIPGVNDLARWDGKQFHPVGTGVSGGFGWVEDLVVYQDQLVVAGSFRKASHAGENIMTWDGKQFNNIGNTNLTVTSLKVHNGILYASGGFTEIGGIKANHVAWYDGIKWHAMGPDYHSSVSSLEVYKDKLYAYRNNNGDRELIQYKGTLPTSVQESSINLGLKIYPNPTSNQIEIKNLVPNSTIRIYDVAGTLVFTGTSSKIEVSHFNSGLFVMQIESNQKIINLKFLKQ